MINRKTTEENIDALIEQWHDSNSELELIDFLKISAGQYTHWVYTGKLIDK